MLDHTYECFPCFPRDVITLQTNQLHTCDGRYVDITPEIWDKVIDSLETAQVTWRTLPDGGISPVTSIQTAASGYIQFDNQQPR
jgi:hypothetical protein